MGPLASSPYQSLRTLSYQARQQFAFARLARTERYDVYQGLGATTVRVLSFVVGIASISLTSACAPTITLPVAVTTSKGEVFRGRTEGPPFSGMVKVSNAKGTTCEGKYTTDNSRTIHAPDVHCSDGRTASFTALLQPDLVSARGTAKFSDGSTAEVGVGQLAGTNGPLAIEQADRPPSNYKQLIVAYVRESFFDPYSIRDAAITEPAMSTYAGLPAWSVCIRVNAKNRMGAYTGRKSTAIYIRNGQVVGSDETCLISGTQRPFPELESL